ncbi:MAG: T9SS type A sorting domain-containing protein [Flavobacteriales bacterium]|nr:T9SS type A sorting domain-containing protein [Flavobacteriales bacterium]
MRFILSTAIAFLAIPVSAQPDTIIVGALERTFTVRLPSVYDGSTPLPLVIAMHGGFGSGTQLESQSQLTVKAEQEGFIMVYPDGVPSLIGIRTWNAGGCCGYAMNNSIDDVGFIDALLDTLFDELAIDPLRVYATGMSNGGFMSYRLACELSERIAAIAPVAATMTIAACQPARPVPVISIHSYLDESVPYLGGVGNGVSNHYNSPQDSVLNAFAAHANCTVLNDTVQHDASMTVIRWHDCDCGAEVITYRTQDGGHSWHGGIGTGIGDPPSQTVSANDLMWDFFQQHTLDCLPTSVAAPALNEALPVVHPNPAQGLITISGARYAQLMVVDVSGREVLRSTPANETTATVDVGRLAPGTYTVRAFTVDGLVYAVRFVRE